MSEPRSNPDLDAVINGDFGTAKVKRRRVRRKQRVSKDVIRRYAFRVLASLLKLDESERARVLRHALSINGE